MVERNASGAIVCTYGHEHGDNPHSLDATFGPMGAWWNNGVEHDISYPWETLSENETKHTAYKIQTRGSDAQPLTPWYTIGANNYIKALRGEYHADGPKGFVMSEFHSFSFEAVVCSRDGNCGTLRFGGVQHLGERIIDEDGLLICVFPNPVYPTRYVCGGEKDAAGHAIVDPVRSMAGRPGGSRRDQTWYGSNLRNYQKPGTPGIELSFGIIIGNVWGPVPTCWNSAADQSKPADANPCAMKVTSPDPAVRGDYGPHYKRTPYTAFNVDQWPSDDSIEISALGLGYSLPAGPNGRVNASGYTDREGNVSPTCTAVGPNCVPFSFVNVPPGPSGFRDAEYSQDTGQPFGVLHYMITNPATGRPLGIWPN